MIYDFRFLRAQNAYNPPADLVNRFKSICITVFGSETAKLNNSCNKFELLNACRQEFCHTVPNSLLHTLESTDDVLNFYKTSIDINIPLDAMKTMDLPNNLHIEYEYHRFHPGTKIKFLFVV